MPTVTEITAQVLSGRDVVRQGSAFRFLAQPRQPPIAPPDGIAPVLEFVNELKGLCDNYFSSQDKDRITNYEDIAYLAQQIEDGLASPPRQRRSATAKTLIPRGDCWPVQNRTVAASGAGSKSRPRPRACRHRGVAPRRAELMQPPGARAQKLEARPPGRLVVDQQLASRPPRRRRELPHEQAEPGDAPGGARRLATLSDGRVRARHVADRDPRDDEQADRLTVGSDFSLEPCSVFGRAAPCLRVPGM
jgi:hypothetical protein